MSNKHFLGGAGAGISAGITALVLGSWLVSACGVVGAQRLEPGWAAVKIDYANGGKRTDIPSGGFLQYNPLTERIAEYPIGQESLVMVRKAGEGQAGGSQGDDSVECHDQHGITIHVDTTLFWRIDSQRIADMFVLRPNVPLIGKTLNDGIDGVVVRRLVRGTMQDLCAPLLYNDIFGAKRPDYVKGVSDALGCPTTGVDPLTRTADPETALGREYIICDKFQMGAIYLEPDQQKAFSEQATAAQNAITAASQVEVERQKALAAVQTATGQANAAIEVAKGEAEKVRIAAEAESNRQKTIADARAYEIQAQEKALSAAPNVRAYDIALHQADHQPQISGAQPLISVPAPAPTAGPAR